MTRNNLDKHISWLLTSKVLPPATVNAQVQVATQQEGLGSLGIQAEDLEALEKEDLDLASSPVLEQSDAFAPPPPIRPPLRLVKGTVQSPPILPGKTVMSRYESNSKARAPSATTQYQLATPASTTTSTAAPSTLTASYTQMLLRENGGMYIHT